MVLRQYKPAWLYEALPYIYVAVGILTIVVLRNGMATFSGLTLMSAGAVVWTMRKNYRQKAAMELDHANNALVQLAWRASFEVGHDLIDGQHRELFAVGNALIKAIVANRPKPDIELMLYELVKHISQHFESEEKLMINSRHPLAGEHQKIHTELLSRLEALRERYHEGQVSVGELVGFVAYDVVADHIIKEDLKLALGAL